MYSLFFSFIRQGKQLIPIVFLLLFSCQQKDENKADSSLPTEKYIVEHAHYFQFIEDEHGDTKVVFRHPDTGETVSFYPLGDNKKCVALSSTFIGMLSELHLDSLIVGVSEIQYVDNPTVRNNFAKKQVVEAGYDTQLNIEALVGSHPSVLFHSGFTAQIPRQQQLETMGITCIPIYEWKEQAPLGKAEWIKVYGFLFGKYAQAEQKFREIEEKYTAIQSEIASLSPSELILCGNIMGGEWYCPAGNSFFAQLLRDANISYKYTDTEGTGSLSLTQEQVLVDNRKAHYWINAGASSLKELKTINPNAVFFESFQQKRVYCYSKNANFYWEKSSVRPDALLSDLATITHPEFNNNKQLFFYQQIE